MYLKKGDKWKSYTKLPFNNDRYIYSDPFYDSKMQRLYFSSNKPNGKGGFDIYYSTAQGGFVDMVNVKAINSVSDDKHYFSIGEDVFISSNRKGTVGGLDIYWKKIGSPKKMRNVEKINTDYDEFGLSLNKNLKSGFLLSGKKKGVKAYIFDFYKRPVKLNQISGKLEPLNNKVFLRDSLTVVLVNGNGEIAYKTKSDISGHFVFNDIEVDSKYVISYFSKEELVLTIENKSGSINKKYLADSKYKYSYVYNPKKDNGVQKLITENLINKKLGTGTLIGKLLINDKAQNSNEEKILKLVDIKGEVKFEIKSSKEGIFRFKNLPMKDSYTIVVNNNEVDYKILICDKEGHVNTILKDNYLGNYIFSKPNNKQYEKLELPDEIRLISGRFEYRNLKITTDSLTVMLIDENGEIAFTTLTDQNGNFSFNKALLEKNYTIKAIGKDELNLVIINEDGIVTSTLQSDHKGLFNYRHLESINTGTLSLIPEEQMDLTLGTGYVIGQLLYMSEFGKYPSNITVSLIDTSGVVAYEQVTDKMGNFEFRNLHLKVNYLFKTSVVNDSLIMLFYDKDENVISQLKCDTLGVFKYRKLNNDFSMGLKTLDLDSGEEFELDSKMLFGSFKYRNLKGRFDDSLTVYIYDEEGILIAVEKANSKGEFRFRNLPVKNNFHFKLESDGEMLDMQDFTLYVKNRFGKKIALLQPGDEGYFKYRPLGITEVEDLKIIDEFSINFTIDDPTLVMVKVYFNTNKKNVVKKNLELLNTVKQKMLENPNLKLEINAYADSRSSDDYNFILSGKRGDWIRKYLIKNGVPKTQFIVNSYGEAGLVIDCVDCTEEDHAKNRRAELRMF